MDVNQERSALHDPHVGELVQQDHFEGFSTETTNYLHYQCKERPAGRECCSGAPHRYKVSSPRLRWSTEARMGAPPME